MKRAFDLVAATVGLILALPVLCALGVLIRRETPGPALFRQRRVGLNGREFEILKLRSMVNDAPSLGGHSTAFDDPRVTKMGRFVRRTSLDELPQLINVFKGEMSIVGPRPDVRAQETSYDPAAWRQRTSVRPGITGLAQVSGRSTSTPEDRLASDLAYVAHHNVVGDLRICLLTVLQLRSGGSN